VYESLYESLYPDMDGALILASRWIRRWPLVLPTHKVEVLMRALVLSPGQADSDRLVDHAPATAPLG
jgi:hypothetical protein